MKLSEYHKKIDVLVSIGLPIYNGENYVKEAINSILRQTYKNWELIISDNGSTDSTEKICRAYVKKDKRIKYFRYDINRGAAWNYNNCVHLSIGKYFKWIAHDDKIDTTFINECTKILESDETIALAYTPTKMIDAQGKIIKVYTDNSHMMQDRPSQRYKQFFSTYRGHYICNPVFGLFRRSILIKTVLIGSWLSSDMTLIGETCLHGKLYQIDTPLYYFRQHDKGSMFAYNDAERMAWFNTGKLGKFYATRWRWLTEFILALHKVKLSCKERIICYMQILRWCYRNKRMLLNESLRFIFWPIIKRKTHTTNNTNNNTAKKDA